MMEFGVLGMSDEERIQFEYDMDAMGMRLPPRTFTEDELAKMVAYEKEFGRGMSFERVYREFYLDDPVFSKILPSIFKSIEKKPYENQELIANYLHNGDVFSSHPRDAVDVIENRLLSFCDDELTDGEWVWLRSLEYYVREYNLRVSLVFEEHILRKLGVI